MVYELMNDTKICNVGGQKDEQFIIGYRVVCIIICSHNGLMLIWATATGQRSGFGLSKIVFAHKTAYSIRGTYPPPYHRRWWQNRSSIIDEGSSHHSYSKQRIHKQRQEFTNSHKLHRFDLRQLGASKLNRLKSIPTTEARKLRSCRSIILHSTFDHKS